MSRIRKNHGERLTEILDVAEKLFFSKGYDNATIKGTSNNYQLIHL